jgi:molybdopterin-biosynthesis enzyme MoeA-like protein
MTEAMRSATTTTLTAAILLVGDELLLNPAMDRNGCFLAQQLFRLGIRTREIRMLPDSVTAVEEAVVSLRSRYTYVFATGGLGPTHDDVTAAAIAAAFRVPLTVHPTATAMLRAFYLGADPPTSRIRTAGIPRGAEVIDDPVSGSPGFYIENVFVMAGCPEILVSMFQSIAHLLGSGPLVHARSLKIQVMESELAEDLALTQREFPDVEIGSYPYFPHDRPAVNVVMRSQDPELLQACMRSLRARLSHLGCRILG